MVDKAKASKELASPFVCLHAFRFDEGSSFLFLKTEEKTGEERERGEREKREREKREREERERERS